MAGSLEVMPTKTERSRRTIPIPGPVLEALRTHQEAQEAERESLGKRWPDSGFVFTTPVGTPIDPRNCTRMVQEACRTAGVRVVRMHDFRHGCVSVLMGLGVPPRTVMEIVGHSALEMTMNIYTHVTLDDKRQALEKLGDLFATSDKEHIMFEAELCREGARLFEQFTLSRDDESRIGHCVANAFGRT